MTLQSLILRIPAIRLKLGIPIIAAKDVAKPASFKESLLALKQWWTKEKARANERALRSRR